MCEGIRLSECRKLGLAVFIFMYLGLGCKSFLGFKAQGCSAAREFVFFLIFFLFFVI